VAKDATKTKTKTKVVAKAKAKPKVVAKAKAKPKIEAKAKPKSKAAPKTKTAPKPKSKAAPKTKTAPKGKLKAMAKGIKTGAKAPDFRLRDGNGKMHRLVNYEGRKVVLYFYPKDDTPGCTLEAIEFNQECKKIQAKGAVLLGVSPDNEVSHKKFSEDHELEFPLLADPDGLVATKFGAYGEKVLFGTKFNSVFRTTFIIDEQGKIKKVFRDVSVKGHAKEVSQAL